MSIEFSKSYVGKFGEDVCTKYLKKSKKLKILERNSTIGHLEADIVAYNKEYIVFVEVKTRNIDKNNYSRPADSVNSKKRTNLITFAYAFVKKLPTKFRNLSIRIDVCEIYVCGDKKLKVSELNYIENAITE
ncbi:MAG: YraN family protein [Clostridia bacterium]|nr:YraN family protein [Clostridia bacterium]